MLAYDLVPLLLMVRTLIVGVFLFFYHDGLDRTLGLGLLPLVVALRIVVSACAIWAILKVSPHTLFRVLMAFGIGSFGGLFGWYFLLVIPGGELVAIGDLLYLIAGLLVATSVLVESSGSEEGQRFTLSSERTPY